MKTQITLTPLKKQAGVIVSLDIMLGILITLVVGISLMVVITDALFPWITNAIAYLQEAFLQVIADHIAKMCSAISGYEGLGPVSLGAGALSLIGPVDNCANPLSGGGTLREAFDTFPNIQN